MPPVRHFSDAALSEHFAAVADDWIDRYRSRPSFVARLQCVGTIIHATVCQDSRVLDFGAGAGIFTLVASASARSVVALDSSWAMLASGAAKLNEARDIVEVAGWSPRPEVVHRVAGSRDCVRNADGFEVILAIAVLEYVADPFGTLSELRGLLRPGGTCVLTHPAERSILRKIERPIDSVATRLGRLTGSRRLRDREYDLLRPSRLARLSDLAAIPGFEVANQSRLPLGLHGWRRYVRPTAVITLRKHDL